jgi:RND family efflux transporter MFP subunit
VASLQRFTLPGETAAWYTSTIYARVNGYVAQWSVDIGDHVKKGQVMALIDTPELDAQLAAARAQLERANADVLVRKAEAQFAQTQYERWRDSPKGVVSEQEREQKRAEYDSATAQFKAAQAQVALNKAQVDQYSALSQFKRVSAPFDGIITAREIDIGNLVTAGSNTGTTPLYVMTQNNPMRVFVDVPQSAAADLVQGAAPVMVQSSDGAPRSYTGTVARTSRAINARARTLRVEVDLENKDDTLLPGLYVKVAFALPPKGLVQVPAAALLFRSTGPQVARIDSSNRITFQNVTIARDDGNFVELGSGVAAGDRLVLNLSSQINTGDLVRVSTAPQAGAPAELAASGH